MSISLPPHLESVSTPSVHTFKPPTRYTFTPQPDITPLEAAYIAVAMRVTLFDTPLDEYEHWDSIKHHFTAIE